MSNLLLWVDCEMTGLSNDDELLEIAIVPTNKQLELLDPNQGIDIIVRPSENGLDLLKKNQIVYEMHSKSGLLDQLINGILIDQAESKVLDYITELTKNSTPKSQNLVLAGNSVHVDKRYIDKYMPKFASILHYRLVDVSTLKVLTCAWYPKIFNATPRKGNSHRAMDDIIESIDELKYYRNNIFIP